MGAGTSTLSSNTSYTGEGRVGKFSVPAALQRNTVVLSRLFERLLETNNLLDYANLMQNKGKCGQLQLVLASQINKEFQTLRFPDPSIPSSLQIVSFIDSVQYEKLKKGGIVEKMCMRISDFLLRFVALVASLYFSVAMPRGFPEISDSSGQDIFRPTRIPSSSAPIQNRIWQILKNVPVLNAKWIGGSDTTSELMLLNGDFFLNKSGFLYQNKPKSAVLTINYEYYRYDKVSFSQKSEEDEKRETEEKAERTREERIQKYMRNYAVDRLKAFEAIRQEDERSRLTRASYPGYPQQGMIAPIMGMPVAGAATVGGKRKSRRLKHQSKSKQRGGETPEEIAARLAVQRQQGLSLNTPQPFSIGSPQDQQQSQSSLQSQQQLPPPEIAKKAFYRIIFRSASGTDLGSYVFTEDGFAFDMQTFTSTQSTGEGELQRLQPRIIDGRQMTLLTVIEKVFRDSREEQDMSRERFTGAQSLSLETEQFLKERKSGSEKEFYSPAAYRAFLLAAMIPIQNANAVESYLCRDAWALTNLNSKPAYAAFEGLYGISSDSVTEGDERALTDKAQFVQRMIASKYADQKQADTSRRNTNQFDGLFFPDNKDPRTRAKLAGICSTTRSTALYVDNKQSVGIIMDGYNALKQLYEAHIRQVYDFLKTVLVVDSEFEQMIQLSLNAASAKPIIRLNESFIKNSLGSHMALNERIQFARNLLADHYFQVEKIYNDTLNKLNNIV